MMLQITLATVINLTWENFNDTADRNTHLFVKFFAPWCEHCKELAPHFEALSKNSNIPLAEVDCTAQQGLCQRYNVSGYPAVKLFKGQEPIAEYKGKRNPDAMRDWLTTQTSEFMVKITKEELKKDAKKRKLDVYFVLYAAADSYKKYKTDLKQYGGFWYFIDSVEPAKIVSNQQGYQFTLNDLSMPQKLERFVVMHKYPFVPFMTAKNQEEIRTVGKQLAILVEPNDEIKKVIELNQVNGNFKQLSKFQFVEASREFTANFTHQTLVEGMLVVFFSDKNKLKLRVMAKSITTDKDLLQICEEFDQTKMEVIEIEGEKKPEKKAEKKTEPEKKSKISDFKQAIDEGFAGVLTKKELEDVVLKEVSERDKKEHPEKTKEKDEL